MGVDNQAIVRWFSKGQTWDLGWVSLTSNLYITHGNKWEACYQLLVGKDASSWSEAI